VYGAAIAFTMPAAVIAAARMVGSSDDDVRASDNKVRTSDDDIRTSSDTVRARIDDIGDDDVPEAGTSRLLIAFGRAPGQLPAISHYRWPSSVTLLPFFTGVSADTATLVSRVAAARKANREAVEAALSQVAAASQAACVALEVTTDTALIAAFRLAAEATDQLARATGVDLVPACVREARLAMQRLGGTAKTTGAGGGDVAIAVIPGSADVTVATRLLIERGCQPLQLSVDDSGVDTRIGPQ